MSYKMTELDSQLRDMALTNWPAFVSFIGAKAIDQAKICLMKRDNRPLKYMAYRTKRPISTVWEKCQECPKE